MHACHIPWQNFKAVTLEILIQFWKEKYLAFMSILCNVTNNKRCSVVTVVLQNEACTVGEYCLVSSKYVIFIFRYLYAEFHVALLSLYFVCVILCLTKKVNSLHIINVYNSGYRSLCPKGHLSEMELC